MGVFASDYIPMGARFGPLRGEIQAPEQTTVSPIEAPTASNSGRLGGDTAKSNAISTLPQQKPLTKWKIFSTGSQVIRVIDTTNPQKTNWMSSVRLARSRETQNLVACQVCNYFNFGIKNLYMENLNMHILFSFT
jgi:hypothetical protein